MNKVPKCIKNQSATHVCMNETCNKPNPFICCIKHDCQQDHRRCPKLQWILFKEIIDQNKLSVNPTFRLLCEKMNKLITKTIEQLEGQLSNFNKWKKQYGEVEKIAEFYECIQLNREVRWTGKDICQLKNNKRIKFDNIKIDDKRIERFMGEIETMKSEFMVMMRGLYEGQKVQMENNIIKIKSYYLKDLNKKLEQLNQLPEHLELKFAGINIFIIQTQRNLQLVYQLCQIVVKQYSQQSIYLQIIGVNYLHPQQKYESINGSSMQRFHNSLNKFKIKNSKIYGLLKFISHRGHL